MTFRKKQQLTQTSRGKRFALLIYGIAAYAIAMLTILYLIFYSAGKHPLASISLNQNSIFLALSINLLLVFLFGLQHSIMARPFFKQWWTQKIPVAVERSTYVLFSAIALATLLYFWQPIQITIWSVNNIKLKYFFWGLFGCGWIYFVLATFAINHFDLFGLRQVYLYWKGETYQEFPFMKRWMYNFNRHPIQTGLLIGLWATPYMKLDHLILSITLTFYILIGIALEERDLIRIYGEEYQRYRDEVGGLFPWKN
ncbi:NnrU protein [Rivularia sp. PCC 7116]|uniref:methyltransferase family protein n=1 Tax=Rivularia sp. PCC 7116 TaxID=373994 RepID=UPI00029F0548|nr:NnrU protein [Rivularia sp. PCC 7116]AFY57932.1 NnrU protein [Rivularia sp. PCC 7116]